MSTGTEKLHKVLARAGLGSRRQIEQWIAQGRVSIDGRPAELGARVAMDAKVSVDGRVVRLGGTHAKKTRVLLYNKPTGEICSRKDPADRRSVFASLPAIRDGRWIAVGRLDINSTGLLLFTNNGELANALMHPGTELQREYLVRVLGEFDEGVFAKLISGVKDEGEELRFDSVVRHGRRRGNNNWYRVSLHTGRFREVRRAWAAVGGRVSRLQRLRYGPVVLPHDLAQGRWRELDPVQVRRLRRIARNRQTGESVVKQ